MDSRFSEKESQSQEYPAYLFEAPTLLSLEELQMLAWVSRNIDADVDICELGPFLGGSTAPLAWGGAKIGKMVYSYDCSDPGKLYLPAVQRMGPEQKRTRL